MYITINSEFKPFTYDELTKPLNDYTEAYNKVEEQYATLAQQTEAWKNIATQENSPEAYAMYKRYSDELNAVVEDFSKGMTIQNRGKLTGLKSRYASEITPIANAYNAMQAANAYRDTVKGKDDSAIFNIDRYNSLDDFLNGQTADNTYISGRALQDSVAKQTLMESYNKYNQLIAEGHSKKAAAKIVAQGNINKEDIVNNIYNSSGVTTEEAANKVRAYANTGIMQGIGTFSVNADEAILEEELARIKAYNSNSGGNDDTPKFDPEAALLEIYDIFEGDQYEEYYTTSITTESFPTDNGEATETKTITSNNRKDLSKERKLANARQDPDMMHALDLMMRGLTISDVYSLRNEYSRDKKDSLYNKVTKDFRTYTEHKGKWRRLAENPEYKSTTFEDYVNAYNQTLTNE
jgi:hypothetical protein